MNEKTKEQVSNAMSAIGIILLSVHIVADIFFGGFEKWVDSLLSVLGVALILGSGLLRRWKQDLSRVSKTMIVLTDILLAVAVLITLISRQDTFLLGFGEGIMLAAIVIFIILTLKIQYDRHDGE